MRLNHRWPLLVHALAATTAVGVAARGNAQSQTTHAIRNVTLVDVEAASDSIARKLDMTIVWRGEMIVAVGPSRSTRIPGGARVLDGRGRFVIPGLWDMHVHQTTLPIDTARQAAYFLALPPVFGVTTVRDMSGELSTLVAWRDAINNGARFGPRMFVTGQKLGMSAPVPGAPEVLRTSDDVDRSITMLATAGADFVKVQELAPEYLATIARISKARGLPWAGHVGFNPPIADVTRAGIASVEHLTGVLFGASDSTERLLVERRMREAPTFFERVQRKLGIAERPRATETRAAETMSERRLRNLARLFVEHHTAMVPTLRMNGVRLRMQSAPLRITAPELLTRAVVPTAAGFAEDGGGPDLAMLFNAYCSATRILHEEGVTILAGTDSPTLYGAPGLALHDELGMLTLCGLSPLAALQSATIHAARFMKRDAEIGSIRAGKVADLVLLTADPLIRIDNTRSIESVVMRGRPLNRTALDSLRRSATLTAAAMRRSSQ